ncbi:hypothetical protein AWC38_SpisGene6900 [Stylophora pistillata]|uniref:BHLH domain-containing protein n=1 Tax=Stylophora pistillata TaxID=50429 RepID=A0A2B4SIK9_STYPI|nr:hypothetical protein AWC38_SpisGene6900 [Stylophora pistillata]
MVESKGEDSDITVKSAEKKESAKGACLYLSSAKNSDSTTIIIKKLESLGFTVNKESSITSASQLCASMRMALIVLEDCEDKNFIKTIKSPKACNEYAPIVFISSGPLSGATAASHKDLQSPASNMGLPSVSSYVHGYHNTQSAYNHINTLLMSTSPMNQQGYYEEKGTVPHLAEQTSCGGLYHTQLLPHHPFHHCPHVTNGNSIVHVNKDRGGPGSTVMSSGFLQRDKWQPSVPTKEEDKKQAMDEIPQDISSRKQTQEEKSCDGASVNSNDEINQSGKNTPKSKADKNDKTAQEKKVNEDVYSQSSTLNKVDTAGLKKKKPRSMGLTSLERKEHHLDKEKKRRERITKSWHWLRQLVPNCDPYADKATVFEMCVAYFHHCWNYHGPLLQQINKDFSSLNKVTISLEDMEKKVMEVLTNERNAFGSKEEQS